MIKFINGNMFETPADVRINTVNCVGVMGAGVALRFKERFPEMFKAYKKECENKTVRPGKPHVWSDFYLYENLTIINFPTKDHWRNPSKYEYIESGLIWLEKFLKDRGPVKVTLPALGCGHGGLDWNEVKLLINKYLDGLEAIIYVFEPSDSHKLQRTLNQEQVKQLEDEGIKEILPSDTLYPKQLRGRSASSIYVRGNKETLKTECLSILPSKKISERESNALLSCLESLLKEKIIVVTGYSSSDRLIIRKALEAKHNVVICFEEGILQFRVRKDILDCWDDSLVTVISALPPWKKWGRQNLGISTRLKLSLGKVVFTSDQEPLWLIRFSEDILRNHKNVFYINYGSLTPKISDFYSKIHAHSISKSKDEFSTPKLHQLFSIFFTSEIEDLSEFQNSD